MDIDTLGEDQFLYEKISNTIETSIANGVLEIGDKLDSVRVLSDKLGVSMSTVYNAYYELEAKGLIESRPRSGYYVKFKPRNNIQPSSFQIKEPNACCVTNRDIIDEVIQRPITDEYIELAAAVPAPELLPLSKIKRSIQAAYRKDPQNGTGYENYRGNADLRKQICRLAHNWERSFHEDEILVTAGCMEALSLSLRAVAKAGDTIAIESPTYYGMYQLLDNLDLNVIEIPGCPKDGINPEDLSKILEENNVSAVMLIPNFNNPLGSCMPEQHKKEVVEIITKAQVPLIEDDIYGEIFFTCGKRPNTCKKYDTEGWVIYCSSFSKNLAPGFRIGWCIPGRFDKEIYYQKFINSIASPTITQQAIAHFLEDQRFELHLKRLRKALYVESLKYYQAITDHFPDDISLTQPAGGFVLWVELPESVNAVELYRKAIKEKISISPGQIFSTGSQFQNFIRISYGHPLDEKITGGIKKLGKMIDRLSQN